MLLMDQPSVVLSVHQAKWRWPHLLAAAALAACAITITSNVWRDMLDVSIKDEESGYVLMVPVVIAVLIMARRGRIREARISHTWIGTVLIGIGWLAWSTGYRTGSHALWYCGADLLALGAVITVLGKDALVRFLPAVVALVFFIPVLNGRRHQISGPLELITAEITRAICSFFHIDIIREGNLLIVNGVAVAVAEACNGMRMVFTLVLVCYLHAFILPLRWWGRATLLALSPIVAIVCNVTRLVPTAWMYGNAPASAAKTFHDVSGWVMLGVGFVVLLLLSRSLLRAQRAQAATVASSQTELDPCVDF
jgi:exosortase